MLFRVHKLYKVISFYLKNMATGRSKGKKKWFQIVGQGAFDKAPLGEGFARSAEDLVGRHVSVNLMNLMNDPRKQSVTLDFIVVKADGNVAYADAFVYRISTSHVKRIVRKAVTKIDDSFVVESKDKVKFQVKPLLIVRFKTTKGVAGAIRKQSQSFFRQEFQKLESKDIFPSVITNRTQMDLKKDIKKISPLAVSEIRVLKRLS